MKTLFTTTLFSLFLLVFAQAQDVEITNHNFDEFHSFPGDIFIAKDAAGDVWVLQVGGFDGNIISKYSGGVWENVPFDVCDHCAYNIKTDNDGVIYVGSGEGFYAWENGAWVVKSADVVGRAEFTFDDQNRLWFEHSGDDGNLAYLDTDGSIVTIGEITGMVDELSYGTDGLIWFVNQQEIVSTDGTTTTRYQINPDNMETGNDNRTYFTDFGGDIGFIEDGVVFEDQYQNADNGFAVTAIGVDLNNNYMWLANQGVDAGMTLLNLDNGETKFINNDSLYIDAVAPLTTQMFIGDDGTLWMAARFEGQVVEVNPDFVSATFDPYTQVSVFPNPVSDQLVIFAESVQNQEGQIKIFDQVGNVIKERDTNNLNGTHSIDLSELAAGVYYLQIGNSAVSKFIKQ